jgi:hypothetical protein
MNQTTKPCPVCGEEIHAVARKCIHCNEFIDARGGCRGWLRASWAEIVGDKTLWDYLSLLIVPVMLAVLGVTFSRAETVRQNALEDRRATAQAAVEQDRSQEAALQEYYDEMTALLLDKDLPTSTLAQDIARARTLSVLRGLDSARKGMLVRFIYEAELIQVSDSNTGVSVIDLTGADLVEADLRSANLRGANLALAKLDEAKYNTVTTWPAGFPQPIEAIKVE